MAAFRSARLAQALLVALFAAGGTSAALAHHSFAAQYDSKKPVDADGRGDQASSGPIPHVYIYVDVTDAKTKKVTNWGFEMGPPHMLQKAGWKRNSLKIGEVVEVDGWLARDGSNTANSRRVTRKSTGEVLGAATSNSQTLTTGNQGAGASRSAPAAP